MRDLVRPPLILGGEEGREGERGSWLSNGGIQYESHYRLPHHSMKECLYKQHPPHSLEGFNVMVIRVNVMVIEPLVQIFGKPLFLKGAIFKKMETALIRVDVLGGAGWSFLSFCLSEVFGLLPPSLRTVDNTST